MKKLILLILMITVLLMPCANAQSDLQSLPEQSGLDAAMAINAMHTAVLRDVIGSEYSFSQLAGGDSIFVLFTDDTSTNYLMISLTDEEDSRADMAIIQCYSLKEFETNGMDSLTAMAMPFIPEDIYPTFEEWRESTCKNVADAYREGTSLELTYYTGEYITCAMSLMYNSPDNLLFTAVVSWNTPLTADDINTLMEAAEDAE